MGSSTTRSRGGFLPTTGEPYAVRMTTRPALTAAALAVLLSITACSGDDAEPEATPSASAEAAEGDGEAADGDGGDDADADGGDEGEFGPASPVPDTEDARRLQALAKSAGASVPNAADYEIEGTTLRFRIDATATDESDADADDCSLVQREAADLDLPKDATIVLVYDDAEFICRD